MSIVNVAQVGRLTAEFRQGVPFHHVVIDDFIGLEAARLLAGQFPALDSTAWYRYENPLEKKLALNDWNRFPEQTYALFRHLMCRGFIEQLESLVGCALYPDPGLHGGGWHVHSTGGILNPHLDYSLHPKLGLQRKLNLIIYLSEEWDDAWGGHLGLWSRRGEGANAPGQLMKEIPVRFARAVLFDTTQDSWHGLSRMVTSPPEHPRKSLAIYYLCDPTPDSPSRKRALYAPTEQQKGDNAVIDFIRRRVSLAEGDAVYRASEEKKD